MTRREVEPEPQPCTECGGGWHNECSRTVCTDHGRWHPCPCAMRGHKAMTRREDYGSHTEHDAGLWAAAHCQDDVLDERPTLAEATADLDPGRAGRQECGGCGRFVWPAIHSCGGVPVTDAARARAGAL